MQPAFEDLSDATIAAAIEPNGFDFILPLGTLPQAEVYEDAQILRFITRLPSSTFNAILRAQFNLEEIEARVEEALSAFGSPRLPMTWWIGPATQTPRLGEILEAHGLVHGIDAPGMAIDLRKLPAETSTPARFTITPATDPKGIEYWAQAFAACYQLNEQGRQLCQTIHRHLGLGQAAPGRYQYYVGWLDGKPVAASLLCLHNGVAGIYQVATLPEHQGQGIGTAMTRVPLREALEKGSSLGVLESSLRGVFLYRRLGFQHYCTLSVYVWSP
jgi:ribosomal protein S18 acetylase RimI-like enzyme